MYTKSEQDNGQCSVLSPAATIACPQLTTPLLCLCGLTPILFRITFEANYFISSLSIMVCNSEICLPFLKISQYYNPTPQFQQSVFTIIRYAAGAHISLVVLEKTFGHLCGCKICVFVYMLTGFPGGDRPKELHVSAGDLRHVLFDPWVREIPWRRAQQPALVSLPGESHGQRLPVGYRLSKSQTQLKRLSTHAHLHTHMYPHSLILQLASLLTS